jgi:hypothetical protein
MKRPVALRAHQILSSSTDKSDICDISYNDLAIVMQVTRLKAIEIMNWLEKNDKIKFIQSISKKSEGDYLNRYVVLPWNWQRTF